MRVWLYCFIVYIKILSYSRQSLLTKQQIRLEVTIISQQVYPCDQCDNKYKATQKGSLRHIR